MSADWWIMAALGLAIIVFGAWNARIEHLRSIERVEDELRGERKMHMEIEANLLKLRDDALADLRATKADMKDTIDQIMIDVGEYQSENSELRRRLARPKGRNHWRSRTAIIRGDETP